MPSLESRFRPRPDTQAEQDLFNSINAALSTGATRHSIIEELVQGGWDRNEADRFVDRAERSSLRSGYSNAPGYASLAAGGEFGVAAEGGERELPSDTAGYVKHMLIGGGWCALGTILTLGTYMVAREVGGYYLVYWGAIIFGGLEFLYGLFGWVTDR